MSEATKVRLNIVKSDTQTPPSGAEETGEYIEWAGQRRQVLRERVEKFRTEEIKGPDGQPMWKRGPGGIVLNTTMKRQVSDGFEEREFVLDDLGNGQVVKIYQFRESEQEREQRERNDRKNTVLEKLAARLADDPDAMEALLGEKKARKAS